MKQPIIGIKYVSYVLRKYMKLIVILGTIGAIIGMIICLGGYISKNMGVGKYKISSSVVINARNSEGKYPGAASSPDKNDMDMEKDMVDTVSFICKSRETVTKVKNSLSNSTVTVEQIQDNLRLTQYKETQIITIALIWNTSEQGIEIMNAILKILPEELIDDLAVGDISVISEPSVSSIESVVSTKFVPLLTIAGICLGVLYAFLNMIFRPTLIDSRDIKYLFDKDFIAEIPLEVEYGDINGDNLLIEKNTLSNEFREQCTSAASIIENKLKNAKDNKFFVTSTSNQEGKTAIASCMAYEFSKLDKKVLLVDLNTKNPSIRNKFIRKGDKNRIINRLENETIKIEDVIIPVTENLSIIPGMLTEQPFVLKSHVLKEIGRISNNYDFVLFDTSSMNRISDVLRVKELAKHCVYVVRFDGESITKIQREILNLEKVGVDIMGVVVNGAEPLDKKTNYFLNRKVMQMENRLTNSAGKIKKSKKQKLKKTKIKKTKEVK